MEESYYELIYEEQLRECATDTLQQGVAGSIVKYHQRVFDLLAKKPIVNSANISVFQDYQRAYDIALPASVQEWYSLKGAVDVLSAYSNLDHALLINELVEAARNPSWFLRWDFGQHRLLPIIIENSRVCIWAAQLNGSDDPPVVCWDEREQPIRVADTFSRFILDWVWDHFSFVHQLTLYAQSSPLLYETLEFIETNYAAVSPTSAALGNYHFYKGDQHIRIWHRNACQTSWWLSAGTEKSLLNLAEQLWSQGLLSMHLVNPWGSGHAGAESVLQQLRGMTESS